MPRFSQILRINGDANAFTQTMCWFECKQSPNLIYCCCVILNNELAIMNIIDVTITCACIMHLIDVTITCTCIMNIIDVTITYLRAL